MTFHMVWYSFWSGALGGIVGYYATDWLHRRFVQWSTLRKARWRAASRSVHDGRRTFDIPRTHGVMRDNTIQTPKKPPQALGIHTGFDDDA